MTAATLQDTSSLSDPWALFATTLTCRTTEVAVETETRSVTYEQMAIAVSALSTRLQAHVPAQSGVAVLLGMLPEFIIGDMSIVQSNLVKVPLNPMLSGEEMSYIVEHSQAKILLTSDDLDEASAAKAQAIADNVSGLKIVSVSLDELLADQVGGASRLAEQTIPAQGHDRAAIYYTGGTTGKPKGVVHSRASVAATILAHVIEAEITPSEVVLLSTALSHSAGSFAAAAMVRGARCVLLAKFTPEAFCEVGINRSATHAMVVPTMLYRLLDYYAAGGELPPLRTLVYGSAPAAPSRLKEAVEAFGPILIQLFGQTECPNWGTVLTKSDHASGLDDESIFASCGRKSLLADVRVIDENGQPLGTGQTGEICLAAPFTMAEYLDYPTATAETLVDGWVHTRDIGEWDERGYLFIKDRKSDMIITGGYNVYSSEVEAEVQKLPGVAQVAVIGIPDDEWGESVCAFVVPKKSHALTEDSVIAESRPLLGNYKRMKKVIITDDIPLTPFGKADKKALRAPFWAQRARSV